jgi:HD-like signal output (HDOD) protein
LISTIKNLFAASPQRKRNADSASQAVSRPYARTTPDYERGAVSPAELDAAFHGLILGVQSATADNLNAFEKQVLRELDKLLTSGSAQSSLVPRLPAVIPRLMGTLRDQDSSAADLAAELGRDAVLVSEVVRLSNSPYYGAGKKITSLERAVFTLGRVGIRQLVANAALKPLMNLNSGYFTRLSGPTLWEHGEKAALACDYMAGREGADRLNAYLAAIVQNVGLTVALQILDSRFASDQVPRSALFRDRMVRQSRTLSLLIARQWAFPEAVLEAIEAQIDVGRGGRLPQLADILYVGDKLAKVHILAAQGRFKGSVDQVVDASCRRPRGYCDACYARLSA